MSEYQESKRDLVESRPRRREIDGREEYGLQVILYWIKRSNVVMMALTDLNKNKMLEFPVPSNKVLDSKHHPHHYAHLQGMHMDDF